MYKCYALPTQEHAKNNDKQHDDEGLKTDGHGLP